MANIFHLGKDKPVFTAGDLLEMLQEMKDSWTEQDTQYLGPFEHQTCFMCVPRQGVTPMRFYLTEFGLTGFRMTEEEYKNAAKEKG